MEDSKAFASLVSNFTKQTGVKVNVEAIPWGNVNDKLTTAVASGNGPDVVQVGLSLLPTFVGAGALFNLAISLPATALFVNDLGTPGRTVDALSGVALFCVAALSLPALFVAPLAARWSARAPVALLRRLFALCLAVIAVRLLVRP